jgi:hypothetical protein
MIDFLKKLGKKPRFHGNGFTQLYLNKDVRLHVWHPSLKPMRDHNSMIHTHRYDVNSVTYRGVLIHTTYDIEYEAPHEEHDIRIVQLDGASDAHKTPEIETGITGRLLVRHQYHFAPGSMYSFKRDLFHSSDAQGTEPVVTIFRRSNKSEEWARVLCGINDPQATHAFDPSSQPSQEMLWAVINDAISMRDYKINPLHKAIKWAVDNG